MITDYFKDIQKAQNEQQDYLKKSFCGDISETSNDIEKSNKEIIKEDPKESNIIEKALENGVLGEDFIEKAVYADTPQNRKLGRVGQPFKKRSKKGEEVRREPQKKLTGIVGLYNTEGKTSDELWDRAERLKKRVRKYKEDMAYAKKVGGIEEANEYAGVIKNITEQINQISDLAEERERESKKEEEGTHPHLNGKEKKKR